MELNLGTQSLRAGELAIGNIKAIDMSSRELRSHLESPDAKPKISGSA